jgi:hypothetical protein
MALAVLFARRPDQFLHPYIWVEDGVFTLGSVARDGAWTDGSCCWVLAFVAMCASVALRVPVDTLLSLDRFTAGPRYFFYPFALLGWILIWIASASSVPVRAVIGTAMAVAVLLALPGMSRRHDPIDWRQHMTACAAACSKSAFQN